MVKNWFRFLRRARPCVLLRAPTFNTGAPFGAALCVINAGGPQGRRGEGAAAMPYLFRSPSMTSQASSASASVLTGEPPIVMALVF